MPGKRYRPEEIISKLREAEVLLEHCAFRLPRLGLPNQRGYDSSCRPEQEAGMDGTGLFAGFA